MMDEALVLKRLEQRKEQHQKAREQAKEVFRKLREQRQKQVQAGKLPAGAEIMRKKVLRAKSPAPSTDRLVLPMMVVMMMVMMMMK